MTKDLKPYRDDGVTISFDTRAFNKSRRDASADLANERFTLAEARALQREQRIATSIYFVRPIARSRRFNISFD